MTHRSAGFIGLGAMGLPMARHLHARGLLAAVGNRSAAKAQVLAAELGVAAADTLAQLAAQCTRIAMCVTADADVLGCVAALRPGLRKGAIVIDHSTVAPETAQRAAAMLAEVGAHFLDAPVSGGVEGARNGKLSVMVGGDEAMLERARPLLECYAARITWMGSSGSGQATKAVNQVLVAGIAAAVCEGLALGAALGLAPERLLPTLAAGAAGNWFLDKRGASNAARRVRCRLQAGPAAQGSGHRAAHRARRRLRPQRHRQGADRLCAAHGARPRRRGHLGVDPAQARTLRCAA
ncbi:6-phosphogluconate dehydrogenase NAD-binding protein, partial [mine drainage metagenome]